MVCALTRFYCLQSRLFVSLHSMYLHILCKRIGNDEQNTFRTLPFEVTVLYDAVDSGNAAVVLEWNDSETAQLASRCSWCVLMLRFFYSVCEPWLTVARSTADARDKALSSTLVAVRHGLYHHSRQFAVDAQALKIVKSAENSWTANGMAPPGVITTVCRVLPALSGLEDAVCRFLSIRSFCHRQLINTR